MLRREVIGPTVALSIQLFGYPSTAYESHVHPDEQVAAGSSSFMVFSALWTTFGVKSFARCQVTKAGGSICSLDRSANAVVALMLSRPVKQLARLLVY